MRLDFFPAKSAPPAEEEKTRERNEVADFQIFFAPRTKTAPSENRFELADPESKNCGVDEAPDRESERAEYEN